MITFKFTVSKDQFEQLMAQSSEFRKLVVDELNFKMINFGIENDDGISNSQKLINKLTWEISSKCFPQNKILNIKEVRTFAQDNKENLNDQHFSDISSLMGAKTFVENIMASRGFIV